MANALDYNYLNNLDAVLLAIAYLNIVHVAHLVANIS